MSISPRSLLSRVRCHILTSTLISLTVAQPTLPAASSLPTGGSFTAGAGTIHGSGNTLIINQSTLNGIINWNNFSIGQANSVLFNNGTGATLNRVTGVTPTSILGQLLASGNVYILNPNGILIGHGATIHTGGDFLASTLTLSDNSFLTGGSLTFGGPSAATVINLGNISSTGGSVYLIGRSAQNSGSIHTPNGTTGLAAGSEIIIADSSTGQRIAVQASGGDVTNSGFITAAQVELKSNGGNIYALAGNNGGQIQATGTATQDGHVWLIATNGTTNVNGLISANNANGSGGGIETSGAQVVTSGAQLKTGKGGSWLLDPDDLTINSSLAGTIETSLNGGTNVTEQTGNGNTGNGDIFVNSPISWTTGASLTLSAFRNIQLNAGISNTGSGNLTLRADNTSTGTGTISGSGIINWSASTGNVALLYNPSSYASPTSYSANFGSVNGSWTAPANESVSSQYTAYMLVNTATNLQNIDANDAGTYALGQDINLSTISNFTPLGNTSPHFTGILDGMGHTIANLSMSSPSTNGVGLFSRIDSGGIVRNLNLTNVNITVGSAGKDTGAIVGDDYGTVVNSSSSGVIHSGTSNSVGGLIGYAGGTTLVYDSSSVNVDGSASTGGTYLGGLVGEQESSISNSYATGSVTAAGNVTVMGGLAGYGGGVGIISNSYATGAVTYSGSGYPTIGGLVGNNYTTISNSYATGAVSYTGSGNTEIGGLAGYNSGAISNSYATGAVAFTGNGGSSNALGGLIGYNDAGGTITNSYATGAVSLSGSSYGAIGGLIGYNVDTITGSYATGAVSNGTYGYSQLGGLVGYSQGAITNSYATGDVASGAGPFDYAGGLVGQTSAGGTITNSYATANVSGGVESGGLVGEAGDAISSSYAAGSVTSGQHAFQGGGLVGKTISGGTITNSYATGAVTATNTADNADAIIGGLVGWAQDSITHSYAGGAVTGSAGGATYGGGLVGLTTAGEVSISYAFGSVTGGVEASVGGLVGISISPIADTYAHGSVTGGTSSQVGGLVGAQQTTIATSYSSGLVTGGAGAQVGGLVGATTSTATSSYFDNTVNPALPGAGSGSSAGITGVSTATLQSGAMPGGFNPNMSDSPWVAPAAVYPYFGWQGPIVSISGTAYNGSSTISSATVGALSGGTLLGSTTTASNGFYLFLEPQNMTQLGPGVLTYLATNGTANTFSDGAGSNGFTNMNLYTGTLNLISTSSTMSGLNAALAGTLGNNTGSNFLFGPPSGELSPVSGTNVTLTASAPSFNLDQAISSDGKVLVNATGNLTIAASSAVAGSSITLVTGGAFTNDAGSAALYTSNGGHWNIYSQNPANDNTGGLAPSFIQYDATYGVTAPAASGNGFLYTLAPIITDSLTGTVSKTYDGTTTTTLSPANLNTSGAVNGDIVSISAASAAYASSNVNTNIGINASGLTVSAVNGSIPVYGYQLSNSSLSANIGTITPATLTYVATPTTQAYGNANNLFSGGVTGFVNGQTLASATTGSATFSSSTTASSSPGTYAINGAGLTANNGNYNFAQAPGNASALTISNASTTSSTISITINNTFAVFGQLPVFSATYTGTPIQSVNINALLAGLTYRISPAFNGPGTYTITASGPVPSGYTLNILPGTFTVVDNTPVTLPSQTARFNPEVPDLLPVQETATVNLLQPLNSLGLFNINIPSAAATNGFSASVSGLNLQQPPLAINSPFAVSQDQTTTYSAGAKP